MASTGFLGGGRDSGSFKQCSSVSIKRDGPGKLKMDRRGITKVKENGDDAINQSDNRRDEESLPMRNRRLPKIRKACFAVSSSPMKPKTETVMMVSHENAPSWSAKGNLAGKARNNILTATRNKTSARYVLVESDNLS